MANDPKRYIQAALDAHDDAFRALREANQQMGAATNAFGAAVQAHDDAIEAALRANRAVMDLLRHVDLPPPA